MQEATLSELPVYVKVIGLAMTAFTLWKVVIIGQWVWRHMIKNEPVEPSYWDDKDL